MRVKCAKWRLGTQWVERRGSTNNTLERSRYRNNERTNTSKSKGGSVEDSNMEEQAKSIYGKATLDIVKINLDALDNVDDVLEYKSS